MRTPKYRRGPYQIAHKKTVRINVQVSTQQRDKLHAVAKSHETNASELIRRAIDLMAIPQFDPDNLNALAMFATADDFAASCWAANTHGRLEIYPDGDLVCAVYSMGPYSMAWRGPRSQWRQALRAQTMEIER